MIHLPSSPRPTDSAIARRGVTTPVVAMVLLIMLLVLGIVVDRAWLEACRIELTTAAEAAALAAAKELASDDSIYPQRSSATAVQAARIAAANLAAENRVAGELLELNVDESDESAIAFGRLNRDAKTQQIIFEPTEDHPRAVVVTAQRSRADNNPIGLLVASLSGTTTADAIVRVEASLNGTVTGLRPYDSCAIPALPIAMMESDPSGKRGDTWVSQIEQSHGTDELSYNPLTGQIDRHPDGLPEFKLRSMARDNDMDKVNLHLVDVGSKFDEKKLALQFERGWTADDLQPFNGVLKLPVAVGSASGKGQTFPATPSFKQADVEAMVNCVGEARVALVYSALPDGHTIPQQLTCPRLVVVRVMSVVYTSNGECQLIVQPGVLATRAVTVSDETAPSVSAPQYVYKLGLSY